MSSTIDITKDGYIYNNGEWIKMNSNILTLHHFIHYILKEDNFDISGFVFIENIGYIIYKNGEIINDDKFILDRFGNNEVTNFIRNGYDYVITINDHITTLKESKEPKIFLTSDTHFNHRNIMKYTNRPYDTVEEMNQEIIHNINVTVGTNDILYILGDFGMHMKYDTCMKYRDQIKCKNVHMILGNHDRRFIKHGKPSPFESEKDYDEIIYKNTLFCLSHYPFDVWNGRDGHSIMCHGHIHSTPRYNQINQWNGIRKFDVGVDANNYTPVSLDKILEFFQD